MDPRLLGDVDGKGGVGVDAEAGVIGTGEVEAGVVGVFDDVAGSRRTVRAPSAKWASRLVSCWPARCCWPAT